MHRDIVESDKLKSKKEKKIVESKAGLPLHNSKSEDVTFASTHNLVDSMLNVKQSEQEWKENDVK